MNRAVFWLASLFMVGCNHAVRPRVAPPPVSSAPVRAVPLGNLFELPSIGLSVRAPGKMELFDLQQSLPDGALLALGAGCTVDSQEYFVARYFREGRDRMKDDAMLVNARKALKTVKREAPLVMGELPGIELEGVTARGSNALLRSYVVGDGFWIAQVTRVKGELDRARALEFLQSVTLTQPWSVHAFPEAHFSVLFPDGAVRVDKKTMHADAADFAEAAWLGGNTGRTFIAWESQLEGTAAPDERIDRGITGLVGAGNRILWQSPVAADDARARDVLMQNDLTWTRLRIVVTETRFYMLQASANTKAALLDDSVTRFLDSLREYP